MYSGRHFVTSCDHRNGLRKCRASTAASDGCSYSPEGSCIGSYKPGKICEGTGIERNSIPEKRKPSMMPGRTRVVLKQRRGHCRCVVPPPCRRPGPVSRAILHHHRPGRIAGVAFLRSQPPQEALHPSGTGPHEAVDAPAAGRLRLAGAAVVVVCVGHIVCFGCSSGRGRHATTTPQGGAFRLCHMDEQQGCLLLKKRALS